MFGGKYFNAEDASQIAIGALAVSMPIAFTQEAWDMAVTLGTWNVVGLWLMSILFIAHYVYVSTFQGEVKQRRRDYFFRIGIAYALTLLIVGLLLALLDKLPLFEEPMLAFKRLIIIAMPASLGAIIVDSLDKE